MNVTRKTLNGIMEIDHVVRVNDDGTVSDQPDIYAPELHDGTVSDGWTLMDGYSAQYGYSGPVMHASEYIGGRLAADILATPGVYVAVANYATTPDDADDADDATDPDDEAPDDIDGWAVARKDGLEVPRDR